MGEQTFNIEDNNLEQHIITLFEKLECLRKDSTTSDVLGKVPARLEVRTLSLWKAVVAECAASFLYVFIVCGAAGGAGVGASASAVLLSTALASGCAIATLTLCFAHISGAHVNPAVSVALCVRRRVSPLRTALYVAAQCGGAIAGAAAIYGFHQKFGVPGVLGCIDGTHVAIIRPKCHEERFINRKGFHSLNVMIICDSDLNILCVDASNPGSAHDSSVWQNHPLCQHLTEHTEYGFLLGDSGYPLRRTMMTPVLNTSEGTPQHFYYLKHVTARNTVERCIGVLKARFSVSIPGYAGGLAASLPGAGGGAGAAWERLGAELLLSGLVAAAYFAAMERRWTGAAPALLGAAYCAASFVFMPSLNPARSLGPSFVLSRWESHWVCWVGGIGGGVACALLHEWGSRQPRANSNSRASSPRDLDDLDKPAFPSHHHYRHAPTYCSAAAPRPDTTEPLYSGTKSLYCRSPPPARHALHRSDGPACQISQSVYSKSSGAGAAAGAGGTLAGAQSQLLLRPPHTVAVNQNVHNAQRDPAYPTVRPGPAGAAVQERRDSVYGGAGGAGTARRGPLSSEDSAYGSYAPARAYRPPDHY